jgi:rsbT co-antagonist protein RsbR
LSRIPEARTLTSNDKMMQEARRLKQNHLQAMGRGTYGLDYVEERLDLGLLYAKGGLDPRIFMGAFHHLMRSIGFMIMEAAKGREAEAFERFMSFKKVAFFDMSLIIDTIVFERENTIRQQQQAILELSTPVLAVKEKLLLLPIIGTVDTARAQQLTQQLLQSIRDHAARAVVLDVSGVPLMDSGVVSHLNKTVKAARLMGTEVVVSGISADMAQALVRLGADIGELNTVSDLRSGLQLAETWL